MDEKAPPCYRCGGTGTYHWGAVINGVSQHSGPCFACQGGGEYRPTQGRYWRRKRPPSGALAQAQKEQKHGKL